MSSSITDTVSPEALKRLRLYHDLLVEWQEGINLVATADGAWERHFLDSIQLLRHLPNPDVTLVDIGTGAGFPGMVLAILGMQKVHAVESDRRKMLFLKEVARITHTPITLHHTRIERLPRIGADVVTSRALAPLRQLLHYAKPQMKEDAFCVFPKGKNWAIEVADAKHAWRFDLETAPSLTHEDGVILRISHLHAISADGN